MSLSIGHTITFNDAEPPFYVKGIREGYKFVFNEGKPNVEMFTINRNIIHNSHEATGYTGYQGEAIELFRDYGRGKWPETFK